jgi:hypothetical protein
MDFVHYDLGQLELGNVIVVTLETAANVRLLDTANFSNYRSGRQCRFWGGYVTHSPYELAVPHSGHWHLAIDLGGFAGRIQSSVVIRPR